jgi:hypothetical protein
MPEPEDDFYGFVDYFVDLMALELRQIFYMNFAYRSLDKREIWRLIHSRQSKIPHTVLEEVEED